MALKELPAPLRPLLAGHYELAAVSEAARRALQAPVAAAGPLPTLAAPAGEAGAPTAAGAAEEAAQLVGPATGSIPAEQLAAARSALLSQLELTQEDRNADPALFPPGGACRRHRRACSVAVLDRSRARRRGFCRACPSGGRQPAAGGPAAGEQLAAQA